MYSYWYQVGCVSYVMVDEVQDGTEAFITKMK